MFDDGQCFLYGFAEEKGAMRLFSLSRIENVVKTSAHFDLPEDFDFSTKCGGGKFGAFSVEKTENYTVDFYDESAFTAASLSFLVSSAFSAIAAINSGLFICIDLHSFRRPRSWNLGRRKSR